MHFDPFTPDAFEDPYAEYARFRPFGPRGIPVAPIGQGTWQMESDDRRAAVDAISRGINAGLTHIDTAEMYGGGEVEEIVAEAIDGRRERVFLASKVLPSNASLEGTLRACEKSLRRLRTEYLDLYLLHWRGSFRLDDTIGAFERLVEQGKIRSWGVSNFGVDDLDQAMAIAGAGKIACNQVLYHLGERTIEHFVLPWCEKHDVAVVGYSPFGSGRFPSSRTAGGRALAEIAAEHGATPRQVALAFLTRRRSLFTIPKAARTDHALENSGAAAIVLSDEDVTRIDRAFPLGPRRRSVPTL
jgi:diketogulonate reductase-like aldo/keto reductase